jgi:Helix-turn-helix domain
MVRQGTTPHREPWLTKQELAAALKVSTRTIERHRIPPTMRVGGQNRYRLSDVERFLMGERGRPGEVAA